MEHVYLLPELAFRSLGGRLLTLEGGGKSSPKAPDYKGAAEATAQGNKEAAIAAQQGNLINQYTPYGNMTYTEDPTSRFSGGNPSYTSNISLSPVGQQLLDYGNQSALDLGKLQNTASGYTQQAIEKPFDYSSVQNLADQSYAQQTARLDPQWKQNENSYETKLVNQGLRPGGEAYDNAMRVFNEGKNDAYTQARTAAQNTMPVNYQLAAALRSQPLNELNAIKTGSQVTNPSFGSTPQQQTVAGPNYLGAAQAQGQFDMGLSNAQNASSSNTTSGLMGLAAAAMMAY